MLFGEIYEICHHKFSVLIWSFFKTLLSVCNNKLFKYFIHYNILSCQFKFDFSTSQLSNSDNDLLTLSFPYHNFSSYTENGNPTIINLSYVSCK